MLDPRVAAWANMAFGVDLTAVALIRRDNVTTKASKALELGAHSQCLPANSSKNIRTIAFYMLRLP